MARKVVQWKRQNISIGRLMIWIAEKVVIDVFVAAIIFDRFGE